MRWDAPDHRKPQIGSRHLKIAGLTLPSLEGRAKEKAQCSGAAWVSSQVTLGQSLRPQMSLCTLDTKVACTLEEKIHGDGDPVKEGV